ncbi:helix-turn-helix transcriptional regulator [Rhodoferax antarcticus]|uniref:helix-turn-helix transcriptional regulator n=1 Tax=Rhodoferax antarcticus TaxID=81479 RepID=UPI0022242403|nr:WYL domain-containing protein [Rhodoferax antarcticus]MCW2313541.1 putative DNA-binding transcriptional regulator YafY [Rhodoferax antarcticus]
MPRSHSYALDSALLILEILRRIPRRNYTTRSLLHEQVAAAGYEVSLRTVQRHLDAICSRFAIECDTRGKPFGYRWTEGAEGLKLPMLTASEALLLQLAKSELSQLLPARTLVSMAPLFATARRELEAAPMPQVEGRWLKKVQRIPESQPLLAPKIVPGVFEAVSDALYRECKLHIHYRNALSQPKTATVWPLGLVQQGVRLYLVCRFEGYDNERILALPRIVQAEAGNEAFAWPAGFDLANYCGGGDFGVSHGHSVSLRFRIDKVCGQHLLESPLAADQTVSALGDVLEITATVVQTELLLRWLRGWDDKVSNVEMTPLMP